MLLWLYYAYFSIAFSQKILSNLRTNEEQLSLNFGKRLRTIEPHFEKHGSYKKKSVINQR